MRRRALSKAISFPSEESFEQYGALVMSLFCKIALQSARGSAKQLQSLPSPALRSALTAPPASEKMAARGAVLVSDCRPWSAPLSTASRRSCDLQMMGSFLCAVVMYSRADGTECGPDGFNVGHSFYGQK